MTPTQSDLEKARALWWEVTNTEPVDKRTKHGAESYVVKREEFYECVAAALAELRERAERAEAYSRELGERYKKLSDTEAAARSDLAALRERMRGVTELCAPFVAAANTIRLPKSVSPKETAIWQRSSTDPKQIVEITVQDLLDLRAALAPAPAWDGKEMG